MDFVVLSSSRGTTFQAVLDAMADGTLTAKCLGLVSDSEDRGCVEKARGAGLPVVIIGKADGESREAYDQRLNTTMKGLGAGSETLIAALGWMFILSPWFVETWRNRIINVHPALLPKYPGGHAIEETLSSGDTETGMTIHIIDEGVDTGPILVQKNCSVYQDDTPEILHARVQELEKEWYPKTLQMIHTGELGL